MNHFRRDATVSYNGNASGARKFFLKVLNGFGVPDAQNKWVRCINDCPYRNRFLRVIFLREYSDGLNSEGDFLVQKFEVRKKFS